MAENQFFAGVADSFAKGQSNALQYAQMAQQTAFHRAEIDKSIASLQETQRQHDIETGKYLFDQIDKISNQSVGKARAVRVKALGDIVEQKFGMQRPEVLEALLSDEDGLALTRQFTKQVLDPRTPPEAIAQTYVALKNSVADPDIESKMKEYQTKHAEMVQQWDKQSAERSQKKTADVKDVTAWREQVNTIGKEYGRIEQVGRSIERLTGSGKSVNTMTGADDAQLIKAFNQFNDTAAVREGEVKFIQGLQGVFDQVSTFAAGMQKGDKLPPTLRSQILDTSRKLLDESRRMEVDRISPFREQAKQSSVDFNTILSPRQQSLFKAKQKEISDQAVPPEAAGPPAPKTPGAGVEPPKLTPQQQRAQTLQSMSPGLKQALAVAKQKKLSRTEISRQMKARGVEVPSEYFDALEIK
jgi:hypothetical protein